MTTRERHSTWGSPTDHGGHKPYGRDTKKVISERLTKLEDFAGHSLRGEWVLDYSGYTVYRVWSYETIIAEWWPNHDGGTLHLNVTTYSHLTTVHQNFVALHLGHYGLQYRAAPEHRPHIVEWDDVWGDTRALSDGTI